MLTRTIADLDGYAQREPAYGVWIGLQRQLHAMRDWTANGGEPTVQQITSINIGLIAARELEPPANAAIGELINRLHELGYYWRRWTPAASAAAKGGNSKPGLGKLLIFIVVAIAAVLVIVVSIAAFGLGNITVPSGSPLAPSARTADNIATLIQTLAPYRASLNHRPEDERFKVGLFLRPLDSHAASRLIPIASGLTVSSMHFAHILGDDGTFLWFTANDIAAVNLKTLKPIGIRELRDANPSLGDIWTDAKYQLDDRLIVTTHDYQRVFAVDPTTLKAVPAKAPASQKREESERKPEEYLASGGLVSATEWFGVHSKDEVEREFKPGTGISAVNRAQKSFAPRRLYRGRVDTTTYGPRIASMTPLSDNEYLHAALLCGSDSQPLRVTGPDSFLLTYTGKPDFQARRFIGNLFLARVDLSGKPIWSLDTGIQELDQILPGSGSVALVGKRPMVEDKVSEPILVIVDSPSGAASTTTLWQ